MSKFDPLHKDLVPKNLKKKGWTTPYGFLDFIDPVTYEQALEAGKENQKKIIKMLRKLEEKP